MIKEMLVVNPSNRILLPKLINKYNVWFSKYKEILKKYDEFVTSQSNPLIIDSMSKFFGMPTTKIAKIIETKEIQSISAYYYLCWKKNLRMAVSQLYNKSGKIDDNTYE